MTAVAALLVHGNDASALYRMGYQDLARAARDREFTVLALLLKTMLSLKR